MSENKDLEQAFRNIILQRDDFWVKNFIIATYRGSLMRLDNMGLVIDTKKANENYARYIDKPLDKLDSTDRTVAVGFEAWRLLMDYGIRSEHKFSSTIGDIFPKLCSQCGGSGLHPELDLICINCKGTGKEPLKDEV